MERFEDGMLRAILAGQSEGVEFRDAQGRLRGTLTPQQAIEATLMRPTETKSTIDPRKRLPAVRFVGFGGKHRIHHITPQVSARNLDWTLPAQGSTTIPK